MLLESHIIEDKILQLSCQKCWNPSDQHKTLFFFIHLQHMLILEKRSLRFVKLDSSISRTERD